MGAFTAAAYPKTGCAGFSDPQAFSCVEDFGCGEGNYDCGGVGNLSCSQSFTCEQGFFCSCDFSQV